MRTVQQQWESYKASVLPKQAPPIQIQECRRAFYAGAQVMLSHMSELGGADVSEDAGVEIIEGFHDEMRRFSKRIGNGV